MFINKAHLTTDGDAVRISMPIGKVDVNRRIVSGFATLDNVDKQNDIVETSASLEAFKNFRGNLREMHQPNAVGRVVSFKEDKYFDPNTKKFYSGVYVSAYVSKGAQDTWEKVLDGTLTGFSIGGNINKTEDAYNAELDKSIRVIKEYQLSELSLVDNPANQFANIVSIEKVNGKNQIGGYLSKAEIENVFWCNNDDIVQVTDNVVNDCPSCAKGMQNIGFVEKSDTDNIDTIKFLVDSAKGINTSKINKEVNQMTEETTVVEETTEVTKSEEVAPEAVAKAETAETATDDTTEKAAKPHPDKESPEEDAAEPADAESTEEKKPVKKSDEVTAEAVSEIKDTITLAFSDLATTVKYLNDQVAELSKSLNAVSNEVASVKQQYNEFGKRVDMVEKDTAFRKSGDLGEIVQEPVQQVQKSLWGGRFLKTADLFN